MCSHLFHKILPEGMAVGEPGGACTQSTSTPGQRGELPHFPANKPVLVRRSILQRAFANSLWDGDVPRLLLQPTRGLVQPRLVSQLRRGARGRINPC